MHLKKKKKKGKGSPTRPKKSMKKKNWFVEFKRKSVQKETKISPVLWGFRVLRQRMIENFPFAFLVILTV